MAQTTVGFTPSDDAAYAQTIGYRSHALSRKSTGGNNQFLRGSDISYNGFVFPPTTKSKVTVVQEYTKDQRSVKYLTVALTVEAIITPFDVTTNETNEAGELAALKAIPGGNQPGVTNDVSMKQIKERLSQPCQILSFYLQGFGNLLVQGVPDHNRGNSSAGDSVFDVDYGPRPQVLDWEPIAGGLACRIQWLVVTRIPACGTNQTGINGVLDFTWDIAWTLDDAGFFSRTVTGSLELARTRTAIQGDIHAGKGISLTNDKLIIDRYTTALNTAFPVLGGFTRSETFKLENNKKFFNFSFTDTEIPSPTPIPHGALNMKLSESLSSGIGSGSFWLWNWTFSGSVSVYNSKAQGQDMVLNKRLAYDAFYIILHDRLSRVKAIARKTKDSPGRTSTEAAAWAIPRQIQISNDIFGNGITFSIAYKLYCPPDSLFAASGMFDAVRSIASGVYTWDSWRDHYVNTGARVVYKNVIPDMDGVVDLCHPPQVFQGQTTSPKRNPLRGSPSQKVLPPASGGTDYRSSASYTWLDYKNNFKVETTYSTTAAVLLNRNATEVTPQLSSTPTRDNKLVAAPPPPASSGSESPGDGSGTQESYLAPDLQTAAHPVTIITMYGGAERIGNHINAPELRSVGGRAVVKYGTDQIIPSESSSGFTDAGQLVSIHRCLWKKSYILTGYPAPSQYQWNFESDGHPQEFA